MANEYAVNSADLTSVANAIREKGGTENPLSFPAGFVSAIQGIRAGGGASLNVTAVQSLPETADENTIVIITEQTIGDVYAQASAPETANAGDVFIPTSSSLFTINIAESGALELNIGTPKIWTGEEWVSANVHIFLNGEWHTFWNGTLVEPGDRYEWLTGGFATIGAKSTSSAGVSATALTVTEEADGRLKATSSLSGSGTGGMLYTANKIDLTGYTTITFTGTFKRGGSVNRNFNAAVWSDVYEGMCYQDDAAAYYAPTSTSFSTVTLPIDLEGSYHVGFGLSAGSSVVIDSIVLT